MSSSDDQFNDEVREKLKSMRANFDREMEEKRFEFLHDSYLLIKDLKGKTINLRDIFRREEIDLLLTKSVDLYNQEGAKYSGASIITFVADSGYKDEPELDENGKPSSRRATQVHQAHRLQCYDLLYDLFDIYNRFDVNYTDEPGLTHFHVACENGHAGVVKKFLEQGQVDPNLIATETGDAPLHFAMRFDDMEVIKLLLRGGADPNLANNEGSTPLHGRMIQPWFEEDRAEKMIFEICDEKQLQVQVDARDKLGNTPLHLALANQRRGSTELLLKRGADPTLVNEKGETPLHIVCKGDKDDDLIELFFKICDEKNRKVDVSAKDSTDRTPLQWAVATLKPKVSPYWRVAISLGRPSSSITCPFKSSVPTVALITCARARYSTSGTSSPQLSASTIIKIGLVSVPSSWPVHQIYATKRPACITRSSISTCPKLIVCNWKVTTI
ncbi:unnamed protein product [Trichogramma brassicae]|uniref:Uncharacterized protein n=1 Tax=Trichogramma brassicae TaxID=86971 RepID=A0A6H5IZG4_9HYME|nr:unnamed protein product [Trichogramma brassicae]